MVENYWDNVIQEVGESGAKTVAAPTLDTVVKARPQVVGNISVPTKTVSFLKLSPVLAAGLAARDANNGWNEADNYVVNPSVADKTAATIANVGSGLSFGFIPRDKATIGLAQLLGGVKDGQSSSTAEELQRDVDNKYVEKVRQNILANVINSRKD